MAKNSIILSVSVSKQEATFLDEMQLSPSLLIQEKINENMRAFRVLATEKLAFQKKIEGIEKEMQKMYTYLDTIGKFKEWCAFRNEDVLENKE